MKTRMMIFALVGLLCVTGASMSGAEMSVPVFEEPLHKTVFQNAVVRVYEVFMPPGGQTLYHYHDHDLLSVVLTGSKVVDQIEGSDPVVKSAPAGLMIYSPHTTLGRYSHRLIASEKAAAHILGITLYGDNGGAKNIEVMKPGKAVTEFAMGQVFRINLQPGQSQEIEGSLLICMAEGMIRLNGESDECRTGKVSWHRGGQIAVQNFSDQPLPLITVGFKGN